MLTILLLLAGLVCFYLFLHPLITSKKSECYDEPTPPFVRRGIHLPHLRLNQT